MRTRFRAGVSLVGACLALALAPAGSHADEATGLTHQDESRLRSFLSRDGARTLCMRLNDPAVEGVACVDSAQMREEIPGARSATGIRARTSSPTGCRRIRRSTA